MEIKLYLVRHAKAENGYPDSLRPLSQKGIAQLGRLCQHLKGSSKPQPKQLFHSSLLRAKQTSQILSDGFQLSCPITEREGITPEDDPIALLPFIDSLSESTMIVGHNPFMSVLTPTLLTGSPQIQNLNVKTASISCLSRMKLGDMNTPWIMEWHLDADLFED